MSRRYCIFCYSDYDARLYGDLIGRPDVSIIWEPAARSYDHFGYLCKRLKEMWAKHHLSNISLLDARIVVPSSLFRYQSDDLILVLNEASTILKYPAYIAYLKRSFPSIHVVLKLTNIIGSYADSELSVLNAIERRDLFDQIITFDRDDANKYGLLYYEGIYPTRLVKSSSDDRDCEESILYDLYFCGLDKGRLSYLVELYDYLSTCGVVCHFDIVCSNTQVKRPGIHYYDTQLNYETIVKRLQRSRVILELLADPSHSGSTLRSFESVAMGKKLLSNNPTNSTKRWYSKKQIQTFDSIYTIDVQFLKTSLEPFDAVDPAIISSAAFIQYLNAII